MLSITIRTDKPEAEVGLFDGDKQLACQKWPAHRELAETIHRKIETLLKAQDRGWHDIEGIVCFKGPGSFTGLRIGLTVANTLAYSLGVPIVAREGPNWPKNGIAALLTGENEKITLPEYGSPAHITAPKH